MDHIENTALLLLCSCLLLRECVYQATAQKQPWYIHPSGSHCTAMALHATILIWRKIHSLIPWAEADCNFFGGGTMSPLLKVDFLLVDTAIQHKRGLICKPHAWKLQNLPLKNTEMNQKVNSLALIILTNKMLHLNFVHKSFKILLNNPVCWLFS
jgi:hypothetical protein